MDFARRNVPLLTNVFKLFGNQFVDDWVSFSALAAPPWFQFSLEPRLHALHCFLL